MAPEYGSAATLPRIASLAPGFTPLRFGRRILHLRDDLTTHAAALLARIDRHDQADARGLGNRGGGFALELDERTTVFVRCARRGGMIGRLNRRLYFGRRPRPLTELGITIEASRRAIPVAEPLGAMVETVAPGLYRGAMLTRALPGMTLWEFLRHDDDAQVRNYVLGQARRAIEAMHRGGLWHADLNLHNLFVTRVRESFDIVILDLDKSRLFPSAIAERLRRKNLARLRRSVLKLDPIGIHLDRGGLRALTEM